MQDAHAGVVRLPWWPYTATHSHIRQGQREREEQIKKRQREGRRGGAGERQEEGEGQKRETEDGGSARLRMIALKKLVEVVDLQLRTWSKLTTCLAQSYVVWRYPGTHTHTHRI